MKTIRQVSARGGQIKACADAPAGEVGTKRKASGVNHHPAKHSHGMKFKSSGNRVINVNHHPEGPSPVTKNEENPQLFPDKGALIKKLIDIDGPGNAPSNLERASTSDLLTAICLKLSAKKDGRDVFLPRDDPFAIHAPSPELLAAIDADEKDFSNKVSALLSRKTNGVLDYPDGVVWL